VRRMVGLFAFFYATAHLSVYLGLDKGFDFRDVLEDIFKRKFITLGMLTWLMLAPLALTSTNGWTRRLGFKRWKRLHRLAYVAGATGCIHFLLRGKVIFLEPVLFTTALVVLLVARLLSALRTRRAISSVQEV
jgi:sulfoxide reductase heme-binding subunit YedZ